jgi:hypothetical protein
VSSRPLGPSSIVDQVSALLGSAPDAACLFFSLGSLKAAVLTENPILGDKAAEREAAEAARRQALPRAVVMAVTGGAVCVLPATTTGELAGDPILRLPAGSFGARLSKPLFRVLLTLVVEGRTLQFEAKRFPVGVNRQNVGVADLVVSLSNAARHV